jgi:hypothetical protein
MSAGCSAPKPEVGASSSISNASCCHRKPDHLVSLGVRYCWDSMGAPVANEGKPVDAKRVFLCHSSADKSVVRQLYGRLLADGFRPWLDAEDLIPGQDWDYEIRKAIRTSDIILVCLSEESVGRTGYVQKEIRMALDAADKRPEGSIFVIPACLEPCILPERLNRWHRVDLYTDDGYRKLRRAIESVQHDSDISESYAGGVTDLASPRFDGLYARQSVDSVISATFDSFLLERPAVFRPLAALSRS